VVTQPVILWSLSSSSAIGRLSSPKEAFRRAIFASRSCISSCWSSHVRSTSGRAKTARRALRIFRRMSFDAAATCWISNGPSADNWVVVGVAAGGWAEISSRRLSSLWRSGKRSKVDGGGTLIAVGAASGTAGVGALVGGCEACAEADAWGVGAPDMLWIARSTAQSEFGVELIGVGRRAWPTRRAGDRVADWNGRLTMRRVT
jgi:hypothetical protein